MASWEKVIKGLEYGINDDIDTPSCPYYEDGRVDIGLTREVPVNLLRDALEALKAQEPRVMNLNEIHRGMAVWLEQYKVPEMLLAIGGSSAGGAKCFITEDDRSITPYDEDYNEYWRAWTQEPTNEQREAVKWG